MGQMDLRDPFESLETATFPDGALSLYLPAPPEHLYDARYHQLLFQSLAHDFRESAVEDGDRRALRRESEPVLEHLAERSAPPGHALAVFACRPEGLLQSWCLADDEKAHLAIGPALRLAPIRRQLAEHAPALVVAVDKEDARVFRVVLGEVQELLSRDGAAVKRHRQGGWSAPSLQRREDQQARRNLAATAQRLNSADLRFYPRLHLAGPAEAQSEFRGLLSPGLRERLGTELSLPMYLTPGQMANRLRELVGEPAPA